MIQEFLPAPKPSALRLVRSFDVPAGDPDAARMANLSWTYDSAVAAVALMFAGEKVQAEQLLDQLAALQRTDGSIDFAFNVTNGSSLQQFRTGSIAWIGLAAATYRNIYGSSRYDALAGGAARYVLARKQSSGLLAGGPDVSWVSTQHNLIAWFFLSSLDDDINTGMSESNLEKAIDGIADGIERNLIVSVNSSHSAFVQGVGDPIRPLDVQTFGLLFLEARGQEPDDRQQGPRLPRLGLPGQRSLDREVLGPAELTTRRTRRPARSRATAPTPRAPARTCCGPRAPLRCATRSGRSARRRRRSTRPSAPGTPSSQTGPLGADRRDTSREINELPRVADLGRRELDPAGHRLRHQRVRPLVSPTAGPTRPVTPCAPRAWRRCPGRACPRSPTR